MAEFEVFFETGSAQVSVRSSSDGSETIVDLPQPHAGDTKRVVLNAQAEAPSFRWNRLVA